MTGPSKSSPQLIANRDQALAFRLDGHHLARRLPPGSMLSVAGACGLQNTPPGSAALALHARLSGLSPGDLERGLGEDKVLLQAWSLRGAPYVFPTGEAAVFTLGLLPEDEQSLRFFIRGAEPALDQTGISATRLVELCAAALLEELDGHSLTKDELGIQIARRVEPQLSTQQLASWRLPSWYAPGQSLGESLIRFSLPVVALQGLCCHAERQGNQAYYTRTDQWLGGPFPGATPVQARAELVRHYLQCYGPSTAQHYAEWAGIAFAQASRAWEFVFPDQIPTKAP